MSTTIYPVNGFDPAHLKGATVVIPALSLGNVPQLAADLLVTSLSLRRVAFVGLGDTVAPFAGRGEDGIATGGLELHGTPTGDLFVLLQRAPTLKARKDEHVFLISTLVADAGVSLVLASLDAAHQDDAQLLTPHQCILPPHHLPQPVLDRLAALPPLRITLDQPVSGYPPFLPGAGLTRRILAALADKPSGAIAAWVVEGDNRGDAHALARAVLRLLDIEAELREPASWAGLFGPEEWSGGTGLNAEIYG
ncbi:hypothetical protein CC85DRAFT_288680 [Cutaneotrichosporon oleaginosum]|uniref:Uncharacterized protein n=1 Tax=Cutaneotrichosporon oleaginosum TaxID=879819 RepID=A0A0J0XDW4_9TREE|nr:uncharacterized protein CC85DRAFT_288680 [Cutaneotrichosporon oleaginosum]KLT39295.1 hypothetical protein CC85DRAFT_288680 [Cutaneotrichosporon oleaginosum]TXT08553.1 hypothetical protein COLE_05477 [Cutaneotrichosporon oleaginosum]